MFLIPLVSPFSLPPRSGGLLGGGQHSGLLGLTVLTDTKVSVWRFKEAPPLLSSPGFPGDSQGCIVVNLCEVCGLPLKRCRCRPGLDY